MIPFWSLALQASETQQDTLAMKLDELQMQVGSALQEAGRLSDTQVVYREHQHGHERAPCVGHGCLALTAQLGRVACASTETIQMADTTSRGR